MPLCINGRMKEKKSDKAAVSKCRGSVSSVAFDFLSVGFFISNLLFLQIYFIIYVSPKTHRNLPGVQDVAGRLLHIRKQNHFKDRALFYVSRLIQRLLRKGRETNSYKLPEVYLIGIGLTAKGLSE